LDGANVTDIFTY